MNFNWKISWKSWRFKIECDVMKTLNPIENYVLVAWIVAVTPSLKKKSFEIRSWHLRCWDQFLSFPQSKLISFFFNVLFWQIFDQTLKSICQFSVITHWTWPLAISTVKLNILVLLYFFKATYFKFVLQMVFCYQNCSFYKKFEITKAASK